MKVKAPQQDDLTQLLRKGSTPRTSLGNTKQERKALAGKRAVPAGDRRRTPPGQQKRDIQFNCNVTAELRDMIADMARQHGVSKAELIDRAVRAFATGGKS